MHACTYIFQFYLCCHGQREAMSWKDRQTLISTKSSKYPTILSFSKCLCLFPQGLFYLTPQILSPVLLWPNADIHASKRESGHICPPVGKMLRASLHYFYFLPYLKSCADVPCALTTCCSTYMVNFLLQTGSVLAVAGEGVCASSDPCKSEGLLSQR